jgi:pimeloyl-ACP methyl ester carboxylesterase
MPKSPEETDMAGLKRNRGAAALAWWIVLCMGVSIAAAGADRPVKIVASHALPVKSALGISLLPVYLSVDGKAVEVSKAHPEVVRALLVFHGKNRNADTYDESGLQAIRNGGAAARGTLLITPQFLEQVDVDAHGLPGNVLRWAPEAWMGGANALSAPVSTFDAIDAVLAVLADRRLFPNLKAVVLAGHSAGAQLVQRYAVVGRGGEALDRAGVHLRYLVANPSSYVYFSAERPVLKPQGDFTFAVPEQNCSGKYDRWKYGLTDTPPYVGVVDAAELEKHYLSRDVLYLLGAKDTDPDHPELDKSCPGEVEGPYRLFRGKAYFKYLELRHPELNGAAAAQQLWLVPGVDHDGERMLNSECGLAALFDAGTCGTRVLESKP